jgi:deoxycytidine triphosphate deaminase
MSVLGKQEIRRRLNRVDEGHEEIFREGTWKKKRLRAAAYDLRIAKTYLITPKGRRYWPEGGPGHRKMTAPFDLEPGEVAFVSTVEKLVMPPDLVGNIAPRFRRALQGILVMGGMLVDPGYDGRLHFQLANVGDKSFRIEPGKTSVAAIQFLPVIRAASQLERVPSSKKLLEELFREEVKNEPLKQLAYFTGVAELKDDVRKLNERLDDQKIVLSSTRRSTDQLLVFGVFLVSITLFGVAIATLVNAFANGSIKEAANSVGSTELTLPAIAVAVVLLAVVGIACWLMMRPVKAVVDRHREEGRTGSGGEAPEEASS